MPKRLTDDAGDKQHRESAFLIAGREERRNDGQSFCHPPFSSAISPSPSHPTLYRPRLFFSTPAFAPGDQPPPSSRWEDDSRGRKADERFAFIASHPDGSREQGGTIKTNTSRERERKRAGGQISETRLCHRVWSTLCEGLTLGV